MERFIWILKYGNLFAVLKEERLVIKCVFPFINEMDTVAENAAGRQMIWKLIIFIQFQKVEKQRTIIYKHCVTDAII